MRILYLIETMEVGGAEAVARNLLLQLAQAESGCEVELAILQGPGPLAKCVRDAGIPVHSLGMRSRFDLRALQLLVHIVRQRGFRLVHAHLTGAGYLAAAASLLVRGPAWVYTEHNVWNRRRGRLAWKLPDLAFYSRMQRIVAVSQAVSRALVSWLPQLGPKLLTIPNGVPIPPTIRRACLCAHERPIRFLCASRLEQAKGLDLLIKAASRLDSRSYELTIAGDGSMHTALVTMAAENGLSDSIRFVGARDDLPDFMTRADCFVLPSRWEGLPMAILEAMSFGLPVVAMSVGGVPEVVQHGVNGWLVEPGDVEALACQLQLIVENPHLLSSAGERARQMIVEHYSIRTAAERHRLLYSRVAAENPSDRSQDAVTRLAL